mgnify:CR=1 FL=1
MEASPDVRLDVFDLVRGGIGQFGVVTSFTIRLIYFFHAEFGMRGSP